MSRPLRPVDDDSDRDKPRNKRRYDGKEKRPGAPTREVDRAVTRSRSKNPVERNEDWDDEDLADLDDDLDLDDEDLDDDDEDDWDADPGFDDDDDDR